MRVHVLDGETMTPRLEGPDAILVSLVGELN
jgi:hypothetical protein